MNINQSVTSSFQDFEINVKIKLAMLWTAIMFCYVYGDYIELHVPGVLAEAMQASTTQMEFFAVALLMCIPSLMIFFSLVLKPRLNRGLNILVPSAYIILLVALNLETAWIYYLFLTATEVILSLTTIWYAWNWPKNY